MLYVKAFHIITMVAWFAALFYLPRLFVYHSSTTDRLSLDRFKVMERRLYYGICWPGGVLTTFWGLWLLSFNLSYYLHAGWMHLKLAFVLLLWGYHVSCGHFLRAFAKERNQKSAVFYRFFNELPTLFLIVIVILVVVKPF